VEYFLYTVIIIQTALVAFAYKSIERAAQTWPAGLAYMAGAYVASFALAFVQLHRLHRARKKVRAAVPAVKLLPAPSSAIVTAPVVEPITALVLARPSVPDAEEPVQTPEVGNAIAASPLAFGLTRMQVAIIFLVFLAALKVFSWALANVVRR